MTGEPDPLLELHRRLLDGDKRAGDLLTIQLFERLMRRLRDRDADNKHDAVTGALLDLIKRPQTFDPAKGRLEGYLLWAARRNLINLSVGDQRRHRRETEAARLQKNRVELREPVWNDSVEDHDDDHRRLLAALDPADWPVAELQRRKVRQTKVFAEALGLIALPVAEQRIAVKRAKDRVDKARLRLKG